MVVMRSSSAEVADFGFSVLNIGLLLVDLLVLELRASSYRHTATACPRFIDVCSSRVGMCTSQWQWLKSSLDSPRFSDPNNNATRPPVRSLLRITGAASSSSLSGWCSSLFPMAVVPTTNAQSATASATLEYCSALASSGAAPTAERASLKDA